MGNLLYLVHRLPYPPNKGDKVRSFHLLKHLAARHRVFLGTFIDDPEDEVHVARLRTWCAEVHAVRLDPRLARLRSLRGLLYRRALSVDYYNDAGMHRWVAELRARQNVDAVVVFSSPMAQYAGPQGRSMDASVLVDFVDVDSAKWAQYAGKHAWPMSWVYAREGRLLLDYERAVALQAKRSFFVTENETAIFRGLAPESAHRVDPVGNGVDADYFAPDVQRGSPFGDVAGPAVVFTGAMDYWPNIDAVTWFADSILPQLHRQWPALRFYIVGRSPPPSVTALASDKVIVTGTVPDVRPYLQHADVVVAPMRVARGVQNKILEAMAMGRPVVTTPACAAAIDARDGVELQSASSETEFAEVIDRLLRGAEQATAVGAAGRRCVQRSYSWDAHLRGMDRYLPPADVSFAGALASQTAGA
jgi:sugar transferase (PEP-CTERM/EpsH1 system associated)